MKISMNTVIYKLNLAILEMSNGLTLLSFTRFIIGYVCVFGALKMQAQVINVGVSPHGIVLHYEGPINDKEIVLYRDSKEIGKLKVQKQENAIRETLRKAELKCYTHPKTVDSLIAFLSESVKKASHTEQIFTKYLLTVKLGIGLAFIDEKGKVESTYSAKSDDKDVPIVWDRKDVKYKEPAIQPKSYRSWYGKIETSWMVSPENPLLYTKLFRKDHDSVYYHLVDNTMMNTARRGDTILVMALDTSLKKLSYYHYQMSGFDFYGNPTLLSRMMIADNLDNSTLPLVQQFSALENETKTGVELKWKINHKDRVKSALIYRSFYSDKDFKLITQVPPGDTVYFDEIVNPMEAVFYKLVLYDLKGVLNNAPVVPMVSKQTPDAMPPTDLKVTLVNEKPLIEWRIKDLSARGFYVYRAEAIGMEPIMVSTFIDADTAISYSWKDTSAYLRPGNQYHYSVVSDSKGYVKSDFSEFVTIDIPDNRPLQTPNSILARKLDTDKVLIAWNTLGSDDGRPEVFNVYRSYTEDGPFVRVNKMPIFFDNNYVDTLSASADECFYSVTSLAPNGKESIQSTPYRLILSLVPWGIRSVMVSEQEEGIAISWATGDKEIVQIEIQRVDEKEKVDVLATLSSQEDVFIDKEAKTGKVYGYRVISINSRGERSQPGEWVMIVKI